LRRPMKVRVLVRPKSGILDPQGEAVRRALPALGFGGVKTVHIGRLVEMEVDSTDEVEGMCRRLLANPTIEEYEWEVLS
jgi:phosphoribosylformylglycinamidine synthase subunit PurS